MENKVYASPRELAMRGRASMSALTKAGTAKKNEALLKMAERLNQNRAAIFAANKLDIETAIKGGMSEVMTDRLRLDDHRIDGICTGLAKVAALPDPVGRIEEMTKNADGLIIGRKRVPIGLIGIIYESRPNVTVDAAALCLKSGNAVLLRGGKEAINSNRELTNAMRAALEDAGLPADLICLVEDTSRESANEMMGLTGLLDLLIPRGGAGLIRAVVENARVPVVQTGDGICHVFVDSSADFDMARDIIFNARTSRPSVCNSADVMLVHRDIAREFLPIAAKKLKEKNTELRACPEALAILGDMAVPAGEKDFDTEFLDYILAIKVVSGIDEALEHISIHSSGHSEAIVTRNYFNAQRFLDEVDSAAVYVNASTRFTDGEVFGLGAEIGISTQKMHARGPMGLNELTSTKFIVYGEGQIRV